MSDKIQTIKSIIFGLAVADALGVPVEFCCRESLDRNPVTTMLDYGTHMQPIGTWSDDTSMTLATLDSLRSGIDYEDIMRKFVSWYEDGKYTATGNRFDIGATAGQAILNYLIDECPALDCGCGYADSNGNGSLMRVSPMVLYLFYKNSSLPVTNKLKHIHSISALTHAHRRSMIGCGIYYFVLTELLSANQFNNITDYRQLIYTGLNKAKSVYKNESELINYKRLLTSDIESIPRNAIKSSGYIVDTLEAAIWCVMTTDNYRDCVLKAVNLGEDTDTVAAVAGSLAGLIHGYNNIPQEWLEVLKKVDYLHEICEEVGNNW